MTADREMPEWVVDRCDTAAWNKWVPDESTYVFTSRILAEFLRIIEERAAPGWQIHCMRDGLSDYVLIDELLEDRDAD